MKQKNENWIHTEIRGCIECHDNDTLDAVVMLDKNKYVCKDCFAELDFQNRYAEIINLKDDCSQSKIGKLLNWCFG